LLLLLFTIWGLIGLRKVPVLLQIISEPEIGAYGPIVLQVSEAVQDYSRFHIVMQPPIEHTLQYREGTISIWFNSAASPGSDHQVSVFDTAGNAAEEVLDWAFSIREPQAVFLAHKNTGGEIVVMDTLGKEQRTLTVTNSTVRDYAVSPDGEYIVFSVPNAENGADIWRVSRDGFDQERIVSCGMDICSTPVFKPFSTQLFFHRLPRDPVDRKYAQIWIVENYTESSLFYESSTLSPAEMRWSADGRYFAFLDENTKQIVIVSADMTTLMVVPCEVSEMGSWSPDSIKMVLNCSVYDVADPYKTIDEFNLETGKLSRSPIYSILERKDYSKPVWSPDGQWFVFGERCIHDRPTKQLWLISDDLKVSRKITDDVRFNHANYRWDMTGSMLLIQKYEIGASSSVPEIIVWDVGKQETVTTVADAYSPSWLP